MDILIIGNGFDLAHGLKTSYKDFLEYCIKRRQEESDLFYKTNVWLKHFINKQNKLGYTWIDLETEIYNVIQKINKLVYFRNNISYQKYEEIRFWISKYYQEFNFDDVGKYFRKPDSIFIRDCYNEQIKDFPTFLYVQLREFTQYFERYLNIEVLEKMDENSKYNLNISKDCRSLLSFNYTNTCEKLYKINFNRNNLSIQTRTVYIHGNVKNTENNCNLVFGTHSFFNHLPNILDEEILVNLNLFKKHNQRHKFETLKSYQELLNELKYPKKIYTPIFHIVGHSLDKTDHNILKHILLARQKAVIKIYYHNEEAQERLINNITEIIGEEEVMAKVQLIYQHDPKRGILIPKKEQV